MKVLVEDPLPGPYIDWCTIIEPRERAQVELGDLFDSKEFYRVVLLNNRLPLELLERLVDDYIERRGNPPPAPRRAGRPRL